VQVLGFSMLDRLVEGGDADAKKRLSKFLGFVFSCGMTTFLQMPSARAFSLAMTTFFGAPALPPAAAGGGAAAQQQARRQQDQYALASHPRPAFKACEAKILADLTKTPEDCETEIQVTPLDETVDPGAPSMVRVDVARMTRHVNHHFDYAVDGHKRKYVMHLNRSTALVPASPYDTPMVANATAKERATQAVWEKAAPWIHKDKEKAAPNPWSGAAGLPLGYHHNNGNLPTTVYLTREEKLTEGSKNLYIPYAIIRAMTMISILRLGLVAEQKHRAYQEFIKLPLYEDMAPWNIVFQGPTLDYIDYDTKDNTFDKVGGVRQGFAPARLFSFCSVCLLVLLCSEPIFMRNCSPSWSLGSLSSPFVHRPFPRSCRWPTRP
jgi:hypothetical protein